MMASKVLVKRLKQEFPVDVMKAAVLFGVQRYSGFSFRRCFVCTMAVLQIPQMGKPGASLGQQPSISIAIFSSSSMDSIVHVYEVKVLTLLTIQLFAFSHVQLTGFSTSGSPRIAACVARPLSPAGVWSGYETNTRGVCQHTSNTCAYQ